MMQGFYRAALVVRRISDRLLQRFEEQFDGEAQPEPLTVGFSCVVATWPPTRPTGRRATLAKCSRCFPAGPTTRRCAACTR